MPDCLNENISTLSGECDRNALRKRFYAMRTEQSARTGVCAALREELCAWLSRGGFSLIGLYMPFRAEPDVTDAVLGVARTMHARLALPVIDDLRGGIMHYALWSGTVSDLVPGAFGIAEPASARAVVPDVILSPCVAVSPSGVRLGNGGGFFDRYLAALRAKGASPVTVAVAYEALVWEELRAEKHDQLFDWIATEKGVARSRKD